MCDSSLSGRRWLWRNLRIRGTFRWTTIGTMGCDNDLLFHWHGKPSLSPLFFITLIVWSQAKNIVNYLRILHRILAPGGVWINLGTLLLVDIEEGSHFACGGLGPLLWHWENNTTNDPSVELDLEELKSLARNIGFVLSVSCCFFSLPSEFPIMPI